MRRIPIATLVLAAACGGGGSELPEKVQFTNDTTACLLGLQTAPAQVDSLKGKPARDAYLGLARLAYSQAEADGEVEAALAAEIEALEVLPPGADPVDEVGPVVASASDRLEAGCRELVPTAATKEDDEPSVPKFCPAHRRISAIEDQLRGIHLGTSRRFDRAGTDQAKADVLRDGAARVSILRIELAGVPQFARLRLIRGFLTRAARDLENGLSNLALSWDLDDATVGSRGVSQLETSWALRSRASKRLSATGIDCFEL